MEFKEKTPLKGRGAQKNVDNPYFKHQYTFEGIDEYIEPSEKEELTQFFEETPKQILSKNNSPDIPFFVSINPYQGCEHGCIYCYARNSHFYWGFNAGLDFERRIMVKKNAPRLLLDALAQPNYQVEPIVLSGNTDPYQPAERKYKITRQLVEILEKYRHPVSFITKNSLILRDMDLLESLAKDNLVRVNISITSMDNELRLKMEPRATTFQQRLKAVETLAAHGIPVSVMVAPVIPGINDHEVPSILKAVAEHGACGAGYTFVRLNGALAELFEDWVRLHFPDRADKVLSQIASGHGGKLNDSRWGVRMQGDGIMAETVRNLFIIAKNKYFKGREIAPLNTQCFIRPQIGQLKLF